MSDVRRFLTGLLLSEQSGGALSNATVVVTSGTGTARKIIGRGQTDSQGRFSVRMDASPSGTRANIVTLRIEHNGQELELAYGSDATVALNMGATDRTLWAKAPLRRPGKTPAGITATHYVYGSICHLDGSAPDDGDIDIYVHDVGLTGNGAALSGTASYTNGRYEVELAESAQGKNVRVVIKSSTSPNPVLGSSRVYPDSDANPRIDVVLSSETARGRSEFGKLKLRVDAATSGGPSAGQLSTEHLLYIAATKELEPEALGRYEVARRINRSMTLLDEEPPESEDTNWIEHIFGLVSVGWPSTAPELLSRPWSQVEPALELARSNGHISALAASQLVGFKTYWDERRVALALRTDTGATKGSFLPILEAAGVSSAEDREDLVAAWIAHEGTVGEFWSALRTSMGSVADDVQRALKVGALVMNHAPMVEKVLTELGTDDLDTLSAMSEADWIAWAASPVLYPAGYASAAAYAAAIVEAVEAAFPAGRTVAGLLSGTGVDAGVWATFDASGGGAAIQAWLGSNPTFDPGGPPASGSGDDASLQRFQRLYRVAPTTNRAEGAIRLFNVDGIGSARDIVRMGKRRFLEVAGSSGYGFSDSDALATWQRSRNLSSMATMMATILHPALRRSFAAGLVAVTEEPTGDGAPDVSTLFSSQDTCACEPCLSVTSPAAYLADLLHWVDDKGGWSDDATPPDWALNGRRPDLGELALSCENTFRVLPYLDLVNEVLEDGVAGGTTPPLPESGTGTGSGSYTPTPPTARDTTLSDEELLVTPEFRNETALGILADANTAYFSLALPHHQYNLEHRAWLGLLGLSRLDLLDLGDAVGATVTGSALAIEELGLCQADASLITQTLHGARRWGYFDDTSNSTNLAAFITSLTSLRVFRERSGLELEQILELLHCRTANPVTAGPPEERLVVRLDDACSLDDSTIRHAIDGDDDEILTPEELDRLSRFLRVARTLGGSLLHADRVLSTLNVTDAGDLDVATLTALGQVRRLSRQLGLDVETVASFFGPIDTYEDRDAATDPQLCLYDRLFMDARRFPDAVQADWVFELNAARDELLVAETTPPAITGYSAALATAFQCSLSELADAIAWAGVTDLTLSALSAVHRRLRLAAGLRRPARQVALLARMLRDPSEGDVSDDWMFPELTEHTSPSAMVEFVDKIGRVTAMKADVTTALYLVAHEDEAVAALRPGAVASATVLGELRDALRALASAYDTGAEESEADETSLTSLLLDTLGLATLPDGADYLLDTVKGDWYTGTPPEDDRDARWSGLLSALIADEDSWPLLNLLDLTDLRAQTIGSSDLATDRRLSTQGARFAWLDANLRWGAFRLEHREELRAAAASKLTDLLGRKGRFASRMRELALTAAWAPLSVLESYDYECLDAFLTRGFLAFPNEQADAPYADLIDPEYVVREAMGDAFAVYHALHKVALYMTALGANEDEEEAVTVHAATLGLPDPGAFPVEAPDDARQGWQELFTALRLFSQQDRIPGTSPSFAEIIETLTDTTALTEALSERAGWDAAELGVLVASAWFDWTENWELRPVEALRRLLDANAVRERAGIDADSVVTWLSTGTGTDARDADEPLASATRDAASAKAGDPSAWAARARPVRDALRERERGALLRWLIDRGDSPFANADEVYEHYLIDVSMGSWLTTSRVQLALASVQLYVQRHLMGLEETELELSDDDREEWAWMKNYRVWEAARKVFLYPENWTDPDLRDDESPFYKELRGDLSQGALDENHVETAALGYLERLRETANLRILSYTRQQETVDGEALDHTHVLARSRGEPLVYYYRRWEDELTWTPWEKVDVGVEGNNILLVVYARRLMLFWITFEEQANTSDENSDEEWYHIRLSWSERKNDAWTPRRTSSDAFSTRDLAYGVHEYQYTYSLYAEEDDDRLLIRVVSRSEQQKVHKFVLDPSSWDVYESDSEGEFEDNHFSYQEPWYQGYRSEEIPVMSPTEGPLEDGGSHVLPVPTSADEEASSVVGGKVLLSDEDSRIYVMVSRDTQNFTYRTPFFAELNKRSWLVLPETTTSTTAELAATDDAIGLGDLAAFSALGEADDPVTEDGPDTDTDYALPLGVTVETARLSLTTDLSRSLKFTGNPLATGRSTQYRFTHFHHPFVGRFTKEVRLNGIFGLLNPSETGEAADLARQQLEGDADAFEETYTPDAAAAPAPYPQDTIDFASDAAYSQYNWELFFHLPWLVATRLNADQRYDEALDWLHCIFDPRSRNTDYAIPARYWKFGPFQAPADPDPSDWAAFTGTGEDGSTAQIESYERQVAEWQADPFNPHLLARLRHGVYPKAIFMAYLDTLIGWGDHLFEQDTRESLQEATQLYVLAGHLLGDRPVTLPRGERPEPSTFNLLRDPPVETTSALITLENYLPASQGFRVGARFQRGLRLGASPSPSVALHPEFCVPPNPKLLTYWDTVEDRLTKIRSGLNLAGERRSLDLFAPPIDPGALVGARAGGQSLQSAIAATTASLPNHRFSVIHSRASALAGSVRALGGALLSALEKRDGEALSLLRQGHEAALLSAVEAVRRKQLDEAVASITALEKSREMARARKNYYKGLLSKGLIGPEKAQAKLSKAALALSAIPAGLYGIKAITSYIPDIIAGICAGVQTGGQQLAAAAEGLAQANGAAIGALNAGASLAAMNAGHQRRTQEWTQQLDQATREITQINTQLEGARLRKQIAEGELANHQIQREQSAEVERWLKSKYTNQNLYQWLCTQTASLYFSSYKLAVDLARQAEVCYRYELGVSGSSYIQYGHWDSLKKGLLAGERLAADLERLDAAYLAGDGRELELTKHVSVAALDPFALVAMQNTGECWVDLPEAIFDLDCPGHYFRRIQAVALSVACVSGPQANVNVELTLQSSMVRRTPDATALTADASVGVTTIVTSSAREDGGLFQLDLRDPRYLPFERRGAVSTWRVRMCNQTWRQLDWASITDIVLHLRYTALRDEDLRDTVSTTGLAASLPEVTGGYAPGGAEPSGARTGGLVRAISARRDLPDAWYQAQQGEADNVTLTMGADWLPPFATAANAAVELVNVHVLVVGATPGAGAIEVPAGGTSEALEFTEWGDTGVYLATTDAFDDDSWPEDVKVTLTAGNLANVEDVIVVVEYAVTVS